MVYPIWRSVMKACYIVGILVVLGSCSAPPESRPPLGFTHIDPGGDYSYSDPSWSPNDLMLVYTRYQNAAHSQLLSSGEIFITDLVNNKTTQLTQNNVEDRSPSWSPDGKSIAFIREDIPSTTPSGQQRITDTLNIIDSDSLKERELYVCPFSCGEPDWSPDGQQIAFFAASAPYLVGSGIMPTSDLYVIDINGKNLDRLTSNPQHVSDPKWSSNGQQIAYIDLTQREIRIIDVQHRVETAYSLSPLRLSGYFTWSLDRTRILFSGFEPDGHQRLYTFNLANHKIDHFFDADIESVFWPEKPDWSHDGKQLVFTSANERIYIANLAVLGIK